MKNLYILLCVILLSCNSTPTVENRTESNLEVIAEKSDWVLYKIKIDSSEYLIIDGQESLAIIKHK